MPQIAWSSGGRVCRSDLQPDLAAAAHLAVELVLHRVGSLNWSVVEQAVACSYLEEAFAACLDHQDPDRSSLDVLRPLAEESVLDCHTGWGSVAPIHLMLHDHQPDHLCLLVELAKAYCPYL